MWLQQCEGMSGDEITEKSGISKTRIEEIAQICQVAANDFAWTMGITHHSHGVENVQAIANLALCRGMVGKIGSGLMPIRGHSNVQELEVLRVTPKLKDEIFEAFGRNHSLQLPTTQGMDTLACMEAAEESMMDVGFFLGGNLYGSNPDSNFAANALSKLKMSIMLNTTLNTGHFNGLAEESYILPVLARDEEAAHDTGIYVQLCSTE